MAKKEEKVKALENLAKNMALSEAIVMNNNIEFRYKEDKYRTRLPKTGESLEAEEKRNELYLKLLNDDTSQTMTQLTETYKKKGINLGELDKEFEDVQKRLEPIQLKLAKTSSENKEAVESLKEEIKLLQDIQIGISRRKMSYLQYSIEAKTEHFWYLYLTYLCTEGWNKKNKKWLRLWNTYEEFEKSDEVLSGTALLHMTDLLIKMRIPRKILEGDSEK